MGVGPQSEGDLARGVDDAVAARTESESKRISPVISAGLTGFIAHSLRLLPSPTHVPSGRWWSTDVRL